MSLSSKTIHFFQGERRQIQFQVKENDALIDLTDKTIIVFMATDEVQETSYSWSNITHPLIVVKSTSCNFTFNFFVPAEMTAEEGNFVLEYKVYDSSEELITKFQLRFRITYSLEYLPPGANNVLPPGVLLPSPGVIFVNDQTELDALTNVFSGMVVYVYGAGPDILVSENSDPAPRVWISLINDSIERGWVLFGLSIVADIAERDAYAPITDGKSFLVLNGAGGGEEYHIAEVDINDNITWHIVGGGALSAQDIEDIFTLLFPQAFSLAFDAAFPASFSTAYNNVFPLTFDTRLAAVFPNYFNPSFDARLLSSFAGHFNPSFDTRFGTTFPGYFDPSFDARFATTFPLSFDPAFDARFNTTFTGYFNPAFDARFATTFALNIANYYTKTESDLLFTSGNKKILENVQMEQSNQLWTNGNLLVGATSSGNNIGVSPFSLVPAGKRPVLRVSGEATIGGTAGEYFALRIIFKDDLGTPFEEKIMGVKNYQSIGTSPVNYKIDEEFVLYGLPGGGIPVNFIIDMSALFPSSLSLGTYNINFKIQTVGYID